MLRLLGIDATIKNLDNLNPVPHREGRLNGWVGGGVSRGKHNVLFLSQLSVEVFSIWGYSMICTNYAITMLHLLDTHVRTKVFLKGKTPARPPKPQIT